MANLLAPQWVERDQRTVMRRIQVDAARVASGAELASAMAQQSRQNNTRVWPEPAIGGERCTRPCPALPG